MGVSKRRQVTKFQEGVNGNFRDAYSNNESDLNVFNNRNILIDSPAANIGSISFVIEKTANLGRLFTKGTTTINVSDIIVPDKSVVVYNNDGFVYTNSIKGVSHTKDFTVAGNITIGNGGGSNEDFTISHLIFYSTARDLTEEEIQFLSDNIGIAPESAHSIILAHYAFTERALYKATAAFIIKNTQFSVGDNVVAFDTVEQYNVLLANHAKAINYTDNELGIVNTNSQTVKNDFYKKEILIKLGVKSQSPQNQIRYNSPATYITIGNDISFLCEITPFLDILSSDINFIFSHGDFVGDHFAFSLNGLTTKIANSVTNFSFSTIRKLKKGSTCRFGFSYNSSTGDAIIVRNISGIIDKDTFNFGTWTSSGPTNLFGQHKASNFSGFVGNRGILHGSVLQETDLDLWVDFKEIVTIPSSQLRTSGIFNLDVDNTISDESGNGNTANFILSSGTSLLSWDTDKLKRGGESWVEKTLLPEITQSLFHETGISISASYSSIVGMGFTIQLLADISLLSEIITGLPSITKFTFNGVEVSNEAAIVTALNLNELCHVDLEWATASPTITFVHTGENYNLIRDYYIDETLDILERKRLTDNILFANPSLQLQQKFNYYALHNEGNYVEGATNPENIPLIDVDAIGNRESLGWTGGDAAAKLADLVANISLISDLR